MATDVEVKNHIIVPCCMRDRTFGAYVNEARNGGHPILARTSGDVTAKHYLDFLVDYTPGCKAMYVALPKLTREVIYQLRDMLSMECRIDGNLIKRVPKLYLFTREDEASGNALMVELADSVFAGYGDRAKVVRMNDVSQSIIAMDHNRCPITVLGTIPVKAARKSQLHVVTIIGDVVLTDWVSKALRSVGKIKG